MAAGLSDRDRKLLWGRSGSLCAMCRRLLIVSGARGIRDAVIGQEAHILGKSPAGPRGDVLDYDKGAYENFILLCPTDHATVDSQPDDYSAERLRRIKADHEEWVATRLSEGDEGDLVPRDFPEDWPLRLSDRDLEYNRITDALDDAERGRGARVAVVTGIGGVGKTALSSYWFMQHRDRFQGGQLLGDFSRRGHGRTLDVSDVLAGFLRELGADESVIPTSFDERRREFRRRTSDRKLLILLDDVEHPAQVKSLLPTGPGSLVLVTSQHHLEELLFDGAHAVPLQPMDEPTARRFLSDRLGVDKVDAEPHATSRLIEQCGGLPVTLCVCAAKALYSYSIAQLVERIDSADRPLEEMSGDERHSIQAIFDFAYSDLNENAQLVYRRLGLFEGSGFTLPVAMALAGVTAQETAASIDELSDVYLVDPLPARFKQHDLVREHARLCVSADEPAQHKAAIRRLVDWYYGTLRAADRAVTPDRLRLTNDVAVEAPGAPQFASLSDAFTWFDLEWQNILSVIRQARDVEYFERVWQMAEALWPFCYNHKHYSLWTEAYTLGVEAAVALGDACAEARMRSALARAHSDQGEFDKAADQIRLSVDAMERCDNERLGASVTEFDAIMRYERGDIPGALNRFQEARSMFAACQATRGVAIQDYQIGKCLLELGAAQRALDSLGLAYDAFAAIGDEIIMGRVLRRQGEALFAVSRPEEAREEFNKAMAIAGRLNLRHDQAQIYECLADVADVERQPTEARRCREAAHRIYQAIGHPRAAADLAGERLSGSGDQVS